MKILSYTASLLLGLSSMTTAQEKPLSVEKLIANGKFALIVNEVELKPGKWGVRKQSVGLFSVMGASPGSSIQQMYAYESTKSPSGQSLFRIPTNGGSYFDYYRIDQRPSKTVDEKVPAAVYLIQNGDDLFVRNIETPQSVSQILDNDLSSFSRDQYTLKKTKYRNGRHYLTYQSTSKGDYTKIFLTISNNGKTTLQAPPQNEYKANLIGYVTELVE